MKLRIILSLLLLITPLLSLAERPDFNGLDVGYTQMNFAEDTTADGLEFKYFATLSHNTYFTTDNFLLVEDLYDVRFNKFGFGYKYTLFDDSVLFAQASYVLLRYADKNGDIEQDVVVDFSGITGELGPDTDGYELAFGGRSMLTRDIEISAVVEYMNIENRSNLSTGLGLSYYFASQFAVYTEYSYASNLSRFSAGIRFSF